MDKPAAARDRRNSLFFTRSRPYKKNDQATIESRNNHLVRKYAFYYRYDTAEEREALNRLWPLVNDRLNYLTPTKKPVGAPTATVAGPGSTTSRNTPWTASSRPTCSARTSRPN